MKNIDIILLEDDPIDSIKIEIMLSTSISDKYNFRLIETFKDIDLLLQYLIMQPIDLIISDIFTKTRATGIELLKKLKNSEIPIILITQSTENNIYIEAKAIRDIHYLIKPFHQITLQSSIEKAIDDYEKRKSLDFLDKKYLYLKGKGDNLERVLFENIVFFEADGNYCYIYTKQKKYILKKSLNKLLLEDLDDNFIRIHHKFAINIYHVKIIRNQTLQMIGEIELPIGKTFKKSVHIKATKKP